MRWKTFAIVGLLVLSLFIVSCGKNDTLSFDQIKGTVSNVASLKFLCSISGTPLATCGAGDNIVALMRILVGVMTFALLYMGSRLVPGLNQNQSISIVVCLVLTIMTVIFIPAQILVGIGGAYATIISFILIGIPVFAGGVALYMIPSTSRGLILIKMVVISLLLWVLIAIKTNALAIVPGLV